MATTMKSLMDSRRWALLAAGVTLMSALVLSLGATKAFAIEFCIYDHETSHCDLPGDGDNPSVTGVSPQDGATGVSRNTDVMVSFSAGSSNMDFDSVNTDTFKLYLAGTSQQIPATVYFYGLQNGYQTFVLDPYGSGTGRLDANAKYRVVVTTGVQNSLTNHLLSEKVWYFTTANGTAPYVTRVSPPDGATGVSMSTNIKVTFSEEMDPATINGSTFQLHRYVYMCDRYTATCTFYFSQIPATVRKDPTDTTGRTYLLDPYDATSTLLAANSRYRVTLTTGVRDLEDEYPLPSYKEWYFKTGSY